MSKLRAILLGGASPLCFGEGDAPATPEEVAPSVLSRREIMKVGTWHASTGKVEVDQAMLDRIVSNYQALNSAVPGFAVPIKLGHNKRTGEPAYGYATNVSSEAGTLFADFEDVPPEILDAIQAKRYNSVSVEVWPKVDYGGKTYRDVLSAVALLGAEWPAVKGLKPVYASEFAAGEPVTLSQDEEAEMPNFTQEQYDAGVAAVRTELTAQITSLTERAERAEVALAAFVEADEKNQIAAIIKAAEEKGSIVPANKPKVEAFAETLRLSVKDAEARKGMIATFKEFVEALPKKADFSEQSAAEDTAPGSEDRASAVVDKKAKELMAADAHLTYGAALQKVFAADPDLKTRYAEETR